MKIRDGLCCADAGDDFVIFEVTPSRNQVFLNLATLFRIRLQLTLNTS